MKTGTTFNITLIADERMLGNCANCETNNATIHNLVEKYIVSFGSYQYKPGKLYSENKVIN